MKVAVVILNWNGKKFLEQFLPNVIKNSADDAEVIIADNASTDNSVAFLNQYYPNIRIIQNKENSGFAKGYNDALANIEADYYVLLNSDIQVTPGWIKPVINLIEKDINIAACQPKILSYYKPERFEYAGAAGGFIDKFGYPFCRGRIFQTLEEDYEQYNDVAEIFWATGACMFIRAELFHLLGGFDDDFFAHMEEIDLCWRLKNAGFKIMYCPDSSVYHIGGGTLPKESYRKTYLNFKNNIILLYKNLPSKKIFPILGLRFILDGIAGLKFFLSGNYKDFFAVIRAHFTFYSTFQKHYQKRKLIKHNNVSKIYQRSIVFDYYFLSKKYFSNFNQDKFSK